MKPPITQEGQAAANRIKEARQNVNNGATAAEARATVRQIENPTRVKSTPSTAAISSENLAPRVEATLATPTVPTESASLQSEIQTNADTFTENLQKEADRLKPGQTNGLQSYIDQLTSSQGLTARTDSAYRQTGGVDDVQVELNDINDQIRKEQRSLDLAKRNITEKGGGLASGAAAEVGNLERVSLQKQADLSIIQMAVQGRYDSAKAIADRAVSAQLEKQTNDLAIAKFNYDENKELFTKAEQRAFEAKVADRERKLTEEADNLKAIKEFALTALQAGAPTSLAQQAMGAKTMDEAMSLVGGYLRPKPVTTTIKAPDLQNFGTSDSPIWKQWDAASGAWTDVPGGVVETSGGPLKKVTGEEIQKVNDTAIGLDSFNSIVDTLTTSIEDSGTQVLFGEEAGKRGSAKTSLLLAMKKLEGTGALDQGTIDVLSAAIPSNKFFATEASQKAALEQLKTVVNEKASAYINSYENTTASIDPRTSRIFETKYEPLPTEDELEIKQILGNSAATTSQFTPASYY